MEIYEPREDSNLLANQVIKTVTKNVKALDMGTGSGVIVEALLTKTNDVTGADINPYAIEYASKKYPKAKFVQSDLFNNIKDKYDVITFNPPYLPEDKREDLETALMTTGGTEGYELLIKFLTQAIKHLNKTGCILALFSTLSKPDVILKKAEEIGYKHETLASQKIFFETLYVVRFTPILKP